MAFLVSGGPQRLPGARPQVVQLLGELHGVGARGAHQFPEHVFDVASSRCSPTGTARRRSPVGHRRGRCTAAPPTLGRESVGPVRRPGLSAGRGSGLGGEQPVDVGRARVVRRAAAMTAEEHGRAGLGDGQDEVDRLARSRRSSARGATSSGDLGDREAKTKGPRSTCMRRVRADGDRASTRFTASAVGPAAWRSSAGGDRPEPSGRRRRVDLPGRTSPSVSRTAISVVRAWPRRWAGTGGSEAGPHRQRVNGAPHRLAAAAELRARRRTPTRVRGVVRGVSTRARHRTRCRRRPGAFLEQVRNQHGPGRHVDAGPRHRGAGGRVRRARPFRRTGRARRGFEFTNAMALDDWSTFDRRGSGCSLISRISRSRESNRPSQAQAGGWRTG